MTDLASCTLRIAAVQCRPLFDDAARAIAVVADRMRWADERGVDLVLFPEAFLLGHSYDAATIVRRAQAASGGALDALCRAVAEHRATLVVGAFEVVAGDIRNSALVIEAGGCVGRYCKAYPNEPGVVAGRDFPVFARSGVRYGINICNDANHPDAAQHVVAGGAGAILYPLNNMLPPATAERWRERSVANLTERARQTGCWVVSSDVVGVSGDLVSHGCTAIVAPDGTVVARVAEGEEGVAVHSLTPGGPS